MSIFSRFFKDPPPDRQKADGSERRSVFQSPALEKLLPKLKRFKFPLLILALGLLLAILPGRKQQEDRTERTAAATQEQETETLSSAERYRQQMERALEAALSNIAGAGRVEVLLTLKNGGTVQYLNDVETTTQQNGDTLNTAVRQSTVLFQRDSAYDEAAVVKTEYPLFQGALVVSEGAGNATVRLAITEAVSALLGLGTDRITVVKMK